MALSRGLVWRKLSKAVCEDSMYWSTSSTWLVGEVAQVLPEPGSIEVMRYQSSLLLAKERTFNAKTLAGTGLDPFAVEQRSLMEE